MPDAPAVDFLTQHAENHPDKPAIIEDHPDRGKLIAIREVEGSASTQSIHVVMNGSSGLHTRPDQG